MIELSLGTARRESFDVEGGGDDEGVELLRVRDVGWSGLTIALAAALMMVTCRVSTDRNMQRDFSYFKTSAPGDSTKAIVDSSDEPIKVLLFFPEVNEVKDQVRGYFDALSAATGNKLDIEEHDHFLDADLASKYKVSKDGVIVLVRGGAAGSDAAKPPEKSQTLEVDVDIEKARKGASKLRNFDREVNTALLKLMREKRKAYVIKGHGEINDPESIPPELRGSKVHERRMTEFKKRLASLNYEVKDLGLIDLAKDVPDDATVVILLSPSVALQPAELDSLDRYLARGGRLMIALDPEGDPTLGPLEGRLGVKYEPFHLTDDHNFLPQRGLPSDHRFVITTQFSAHASTTALSRSVDKGLILIDSGALDEVPFTEKGEAPKRTITIHSMDTSFLDYNNNFQFDPDPPSGLAEKRQKYNIAAAIEGPKLKGQGSDGKDKDGFRALVFADADLFADALVQNGMGHAQVVMVSGPLLDDAIHWLGGEEVFAGEVVSEDDKPIQHTKSEDSTWFVVTIVGVPLLVLAIGLYMTMGRKRRTKTGEVTP
jgi:hypothetical protein